MRISATGKGRSPAKAGVQFVPARWTRAFAEARSRVHALGFTLVELLVVLTLIGLMSAAVILAMPDPRGTLAAEAERFAARSAAARDKAIVDAAAMSVRVTAAGYGFDRRDGSEWRPLDGKPFVEQAWKQGTQATIAGEGAMRIVFDPTGIAEPARVTLVRDDETMAVTIGADGEVDVVR